MAEHGPGFKFRQDGSIDFDAYRAEAAWERTKARHQFVWEVALPFLSNAPVKLVSWAASALAEWRPAMRAARR